jgi:hypothetical protein
LGLIPRRLRRKLDRHAEHVSASILMTLKQVQGDVGNTSLLAASFFILNRYTMGNQDTVQQPCSLLMHTHQSCQYFSVLHR